jgi:hypothetical protein
MIAGWECHTECSGEWQLKAAIEISDLWMHWLDWWSSWKDMPEARLLYEYGSGQLENRAQLRQI